MPEPFLKYAFSLPFDIFCFFVKNQCLKVCVLISSSSIFDSVSLVVLSVFMPVEGCFQYCSIVVEFEVRDVMPPEVLLLYRIVLAILGFLLFHTKLSIIISRSVKNFTEILMGIALNL